MVELLSQSIKNSQLHLPEVIVLGAVIVCVLSAVRVAHIAGIPAQYQRPGVRFSTHSFHKGALFASAQHHPDVILAACQALYHVGNEPHAGGIISAPQD